MTYCQLHQDEHNFLANRCKNIYAGALSETLQERLAAIEARPEDRESLANEVDASRMLAEQAMKLMSLAFGGTKDGKEVSPEVKAMAMDAMRQSLKSVAEMTTAMRKLKLTSPEYIAVGHLPYICGQITQILADTFGMANPLLQVVTEKISQIKLPDHQAAPQVNITLD